MTSIGTREKKRSLKEAAEYPGLGPAGYGKAVLKKLDGKQVSLDIIPDAADCFLVGCVLKNQKQQHTENGRNERDGQPAGNYRNRGE